jgi:hypothetical protein
MTNNPWLYVDESLLRRRALQGILPGAHYWNGKEWSEFLPIFERTTKELAESWAYENDMNL